MRLFNKYIFFLFAGFLGSQDFSQRPRTVESSEKHASDDTKKDQLELGKTIWVCRVQKTGEEPQELVTLLPPNDAFSKGIIPEAIVGVLKRPLTEGEAVKPENFVRNKIFNDFMHEIIAREGLKLKELEVEARRQGEGWVYLVDARTAAPREKVPPHDIIGAFEVKAGRLIAQSYKRNHRHILLSQEGFFRLPPEIYEELLKELKVRNSKSQKGGVEAKGK